MCGDGLRPVQVEQGSTIIPRQLSKADCERLCATAIDFAATDGFSVINHLIKQRLEISTAGLFHGALEIL
jgi:hypothetical protein